MVFLIRGFWSIVRSTFMFIRTTVAILTLEADAATQALVCSLSESPEGTGLPLSELNADDDRDSSETDSDEDQSPRAQSTQNIEAMALTADDDDDDESDFVPQIPRIRIELPPEQEDSVIELQPRGAHAAAPAQGPQTAPSSTASSSTSLAMRRADAVHEVALASPSSGSSDQQLLQPLPAVFYLFVSSFPAEYSSRILSSALILDHPWAIALWESPWSMVISVGLIGFLVVVFALQDIVTLPVAIAVTIVFVVLVVVTLPLVETQILRQLSRSFSWWWLVVLIFLDFNLYCYQGVVECTTEERERERERERGAHVRPNQ